MKKLFATVLFGIAAFCSVSAQSRSAGGVVLDKTTGKPMEYIAVYFKNTASGCITNFNGEFFVKDPSGADTLVVEAIGYQKQQIKHRNEDPHGPRKHRIDRCRRQAEAEKICQERQSGHSLDA